LIDLLWSEERVNRLLLQDWTYLDLLRCQKKDEVERVIAEINDVHEYDDLKRYVDELPSEVINLVFLELAREVRKIKHQLKEGVVRQ